MKRLTVVSPSALLAASTAPNAFAWGYHGGGFAAGDFVFERATQQVGETTSADFLAPYRREDPRAGYEAFLADIVNVTQRFGFEAEQSPGRDEPRLRGLRQ